MSETEAWEGQWTTEECAVRLQDAATRRTLSTLRQTEIGVVHTVETGQRLELRWDLDGETWTEYRGPGTRYMVTRHGCATQYTRLEIQAP